MRAAADQYAVKIAAAEPVAQVLDRAHQMLDPVLLADFAQIESTSGAPLPTRVWRIVPEPRGGPERTI